MAFEAFILIIIAALLIEALVETGKMVVQDGKFSIDKLVALAVAILFAVLAKLDLLYLFGYDVPAWFGQVLTGILLSRGANFVHDLLKSIKNVADGDF